MSKRNPENDLLVTLFQSIGLTLAKALEAAKSPKPAAILKEIIEQNESIAKGLDEKRAGLIVGLANALSKSQHVTDKERAYVLGRILNGDLKSIDQVNGASSSSSKARCLSRSFNMYSISSCREIH
jgi:glutaminyl-tRNA synthetase